MNKPSIEINLIGTGGGYGESLVIHLGNGDWIVIDSCIDPYTGVSLPLNYLRDRGVDLENVKLIICTHWHDDHIGGISTLLENCPKAFFSFGRVNDLKKFLQCVSLDYRKLKSKASNCSTLEFNKCLEIMNNSKRINKLAAIDRLLYSNPQKEFIVEVYSLSPSDKSSNLFDLEISKLINEYGPNNRKITTYTPNDRSIVILLRFNDEIALLGSDLEVHSDPEIGWNDIIEKSVVIGKFPKASYFKIPHHGSENGYHENIWKNLIKSNPISTLTPWNRNKKLPEEKMIEKYKSLSSNLFITSPNNISNKSKKRDNKVSKVIKEFNPTLRELKYQYGVISSEYSIGGNEPWKNNLFGTASEL
ncbi:MBL fold metallo-hydrolase [Aquiflexum gelatinilyticum]|uniref:MBL fold metallo-hydrolase n=1 Tax=Aquiflexum gelatinilyticum TaxID=2961943 RepID=UPI0021679916|nr:MBL fold metallo-hydrolase [Aquiflexum gelatinilyticum]MCS4434209.1 MBL fold metallo-hydrolase [Aquiflexum gelatinilyticum]